MAQCLSHIRLRFIHCSQQLMSVDKTLLSKLRKKTGFPFNNCKKALEVQNNDFALAEAWLREQAQKEGWTKATKLAARPMSQGLVGIQLSDCCASMVEVNCETDFVARNAAFQGLVSKVATLCLEAGNKVPGSKIAWSRDALAQLPADSDKFISDLVALNIGSIGENMCARRAVFLRVPASAYIGCYVHGSDSSLKSMAGRYGAIVAWGLKGQGGKDLDHVLVGRQLAQHVVGMNPARVGHSHETRDTAAVHAVAAAASAATAADGAATSNKAQTKPPVEDRMVHQEFLLDPEILVGEFLQQHSAEVYDFVRFECGEEVVESVSA